MFGKGISLNFRGSDKFTTKVGGLTTLIALGVVTAFGYFKLAQLVTKSDPATTYNEVFFDIPSLGAKTAAEI